MKVVKEEYDIWSTILNIFFIAIAIISLALQNIKLMITATLIIEIYKLTTKIIKTKIEEEER